MFRASPWISFQPSVPDHQDSDMEDDVDMDAPQISTLREEETPPPQRSTPHKRFRVKLVVKDKSNTSPATSAQNQPQTEDDVDEDEEDEEDQLIDDDDDMNPAATAPPRPAETVPKRKTPSKRKPRKTEKRIAAEERKKAAQAGAANPAPTMTWFEANLSELPQPSEDASKLGASISISVVPSEGSSSIKIPARKKATPRKAPAASRAKKPAAKSVAAKPVIPPAIEDVAALSEGYTGTAASSPVTAHLELGSPEPEVASAPAIPTPQIEDTNLENVPLPVYPLPSKPFPVQPPPKISTAFAPMIPLDKSGRKVRHWRIANREIRGIAGGRWFTRCWVGEKESEFASAVQAKVDSEKHSGSLLNKIAAASISAPPSGRSSAKLRTQRAAVSSVSAGSSRAGSVLADNVPRPPTKMRTMVSAMDEMEAEGGNNDVDMVPSMPT